MFHHTPEVPPIVAISNGVPIPETAWQRRPEWRAAPRAVFVGRLAPEKGLDTLIDALPSVRVTYPEARLILIGEGPERAALEDRVKALGLTLGPGQAVELPGVSADATEALIAGYPDVTVAGYISPRETVIAGPVDAVDAAIAAVSAQNKFARRVNMEVASHTAFMEPILGELRTALADVTPEIPTIPFYSTVTEGVTSPLLDADYWASNVRQHLFLQSGRTGSEPSPYLAR